MIWAAISLSLIHIFLRDLVLKRAAGPAAESCNETLLALLQEEADVTAQKLEEFFNGEPLDAWFDRNFYGVG